MFIPFETGAKLPKKLPCLICLISMLLFGGFFLEKLKGGSEKVELLSYLCLVSKKRVKNSDFLSAALHCEIGLLKLQILFCKNLRTTWLHQILGSFRRVQLVPFSFLS